MSLSGKNWKVNCYETDYIAYRRCCRATTKIINESRRNYHRQKLSNCCDARSRWKAVKKLLRSSDQDNTRSEVENQSLCISFSIFFSTKIQTLKANIKTKLATISPLCSTSEAIFIGQPLFTFTPVSPAEVPKLLRLSSSKSCQQDFIPTFLLKSCSLVFSELISYLANLSMSQGVFSSSFKIAQVTPLLKKAGLDKDDPANYRSISNRNNISKLLERLLLVRIHNHVTSSPNFNPNQSAYRPYHSTETALILTLDNILHTADQGSFSVLVSLDLRAAFDTSIIIFC